MAVKIRLQRKGRKKNPFYHIVIADARAPRDGKYIERIGSYNPMTAPATISLDADKVLEWMTKGAQPTHTVRSIMRFKGILYKKHLMRGVSKGALTEEQANDIFNEFMTAKEGKIEDKLNQDKVSKVKEAADLLVAPAAPIVTEEIVETPEDSSGEEE